MFAEHVGRPKLHVGCEYCSLVLTDHRLTIEVVQQGGNPVDIIFNQLTMCFNYY